MFAGGATMKLAEALQERADLNKKISDLRGRLNQNDSNCKC